MTKRDAGKFVNGLMWLVFCLFTVIFISCGQNNEISSPQKAYESLVEAVKTNNGLKVWDILSKGSHGYYENMVKYARSDDGYDATNLHPIDKLTIETIQLQLPKEKISNLDGKQCFIWLSSTGNLNMKAFTESPFSHVDKPIGDKCKVWLKVQGKDFPLTFKQEDGIWKWDAFSMIMITKMLYDEEIGNKDE